MDSKKYQKERKIRVPKFHSLIHPFKHFFKYVFLIVTNKSFQPTQNWLIISRGTGIMATLKWTDYPMFKTATKKWLLYLFASIPWWFSGKESACQCRRRRFDPWVRKILEKEMATHSSILAWRIPAAEEPRRDGTIAHWVAKESDTT